MTPTSMDTVVPGHPSGPDLPTSYRSSPQRLPVASQLNHSTKVASLPASVTRPVVADVSHLASPDEQPSKLDEPMSETLKPPSHAVVHTSRWNEDRLPTFAPELLPDLPRLHRDPQRGRTKSGSQDSSNESPKDGTGNHFPNFTDSIPPVSVVRGEFGSGKSSSLYLTNSSQGLPPRPVPGTSDTGLRLSHSPSPHPKSTLNSSSPLLAAPSVRDPYGPRGPVNPPRSSFVSPPPTPTADCPQYHPPEHLQPVDWPSSGRTSADLQPRSESGIHKAPKVAPKPHLAGSFNYLQVRWKLINFFCLNHLNPVFSEFSPDSNHVTNTTSFLRRLLVDL
ncbi:unnamed protein product [Echinostoma caproni]|uniref:Septin-type G domain-containing protein n=1 Tax=Echinostoma caproni TaxID=27848 RepID=A0A183A1H6_9TREM|nr:unnamed protein product [Echinostoma caproni]